MFLAGRTLTIENCVVRNLTSSGIAIGPNTTSNITISNTLVANNGGHGIYVQPTGANVSVKTVFNRVEAYNNTLMGIGIFGNMVSGSSAIVAVAIDSVAAHNQQNGYHALGNNTPNTVFRLFRSAAFNNATGAFAEGSGAIVVSQSNLENNATSWHQQTGAIVDSYGDNYTAGEPVPGNSLRTQ